MSHGPVEPQHVAAMNAVAKVLSEAFKPYGFALLVFPMDDDKGRMNYISNARREDMLVAMKEFIAANEGRAHPAPKGKQ